MVANASLTVERIKAEIAGATKAISSKLAEINTLGIVVHTLRNRIYNNKIFQAHKVLLHPLQSTSDTENVKVHMKLM